MLIPVILSGGAGTRLWPSSRRAYPKPFMRLPDGETLAHKTLQRALAVADAGELVTVTNRAYDVLSREAGAAAIGRAARHRLLLEPFARNTAPAVAVAARYVRETYGDDARLLVLPADHLIEDRAAFVAAVADAAAVAGEGYLVTFGIEPTRAETGFGYLRAAEAVVGGRGLRLEEFVEKPDAATAQGYLEAGCYYWNSGMFCFRADAILEALAEHAPEIDRAAQACWQKTVSDGDSLTLAEAPFAEAPSVSIDYAVMEPASHRAMVPGRFDWNDIGSWRAVSELAPADDRGNRTLGDVVLVDSQGSYVQGDGQRLIAAVGVDGLVVVDSGDAVLIAAREQAQAVGRVVDELRARGHPAGDRHSSAHCHWGTSVCLETTDDYAVRRIELVVGATMHSDGADAPRRRWTLLEGRVIAGMGASETELGPGDSVSAAAGGSVWLANEGDGVARLVEVRLAGGASGRAGPAEGGAEDRHP